MAAAIDLDVDGVEVDDFSRFVDHTLATDWEVLCNDIENALKAWVACDGSNDLTNTSATSDAVLDLTYSGIKLTFGLYDNGQIGEIANWFRCKRALVMSRSAEDWPDTTTPSITKTIFSALTCSLSSSGTFDVPIFITPTFIDETFAAKELYGYELVRTGGEGAVRFSKYFYSYLIEHTDSNATDSSYLDGLKQIFTFNASQFVFNQEESHKLKLQFVMQESYRHRHSGPTSSSIGPVGISDQQTLLAVAYRFWDDAFPCRYGFRSPLTEFSVNLNYPNLAENCFVDNVKFTTLIPSKQHFENWSIKVAFKHDHKGAQQRGHSKLLHIAGFVQNILAMFVAGMCGSDRPLTSSTSSASEETLGKCSEALVDLPTQTKESIMAFISNCGGASEPSDAEYAIFSENLSKISRNDLKVSAKDSRCADSFSGAAPVGSYASLLSLFVGNLAGMGQVAAFWRHCALDFRTKWESGQVMPHMTIPVRSENEGNEQSLMRQSLWADIIERKRRSGIHVSLPDLLTPLLCQKLDMMHFCLAMRDEVPVCAESSKASSKITPPILQRRSPLTSDALAQNQKLLHKISSGQSRTVKDNPLLVWQIQQPELISDIKAFKAENPSKKQEDFVEWYFDASPPPEIVPCLHHWESCEPALALNQKPLFHCEGEAEKVLAFLEKCTLSRFSSDLLCTGLSTAFNLLRFDVDGVLTSCNVEGILGEVYGKLDSLKNSIVRTIGLIQNSCLHPDSKDSVESIKRAVLAVHGVVAELEELENVILRLREVTSVVQVFSEKSWRILFALAHSDEVKAEDSEEANLLFELAKRVSKGPNHNNWHSYDARELGQPSKKEVVIKYDSTDRVYMQALVGIQSARIAFTYIEEEK